MSGKFHFECVDCRRTYPGDGVLYLCPDCEKLNEPGQPPKGVLKTIYPYTHIMQDMPAGSAFRWLDERAFLPLLPICSMDSWPTLRVGGTPLYRVKTVGHGDKQTSGQAKDGFEVFLKDDSQNPTFSFKDRASALVSAWAKENGIMTLVAASTGNAGSSLAGICASQGQKAIIVSPAAAPLAKLTQILMYGATLIPVKGTYDHAFDLSIQISRKYGFYNRNTAYNPFTIEGKKTVSFELFQQLGSRVPDRIFIPVGDGVILAGVCRGFEDLLQLGIIRNMPLLVAVQAQGSCNLINNLGKASFLSRPSDTIADSISVDVPRCFNLAASMLAEYHGETFSVTDREILDASVKLSQKTGIFSEPAAVAAYAAWLKYCEKGLIHPGSTNVVLLTGSGLKDLTAVQSSIQIPEPVEPDSERLGSLFPENFVRS